MSIYKSRARSMVAAVSILSLSLIAYVLAKQPATDEISPKLNAAVQSLNNGFAEEALEMLQTIDTNDPGYGASRFYLAQGLHRTGNAKEFLNVIETLDLDSSLVDPRIKEDLAKNAIQALFQYRRFDAVIERTSQFQSHHANSADLPLVMEHRTAAWFEKGRKAASDAFVVRNDPERLAKRHRESRAALTSFLDAARPLEKQGYNALTQRNLSEEIWIARLILEDNWDSYSAEVLDGVSERFSFLRIQLHRDLHKDKVDRNIQMLSDFLQRFPGSEYRAWMAFHLADFVFQKGKRLSQEAEAADTGNPAAAAQKRAQAQQLFAYLRALEPNIITNALTGIAESDVEAYRDDLLDTYYFEKNIDELFKRSAALVAASARGTVPWMKGTFFEALAAFSQQPPDSARAIRLLDSILQEKFTGRPEPDHWLICAAKWRAHLALLGADLRKVVELTRWVEAANCRNNMKAEFLSVYGTLEGLPQD